MLVNRSHGGWFTLVFATTLVASLAYLWYATHESNGPTGGSWQGLWFGIAGTSCMVFAGLLSGRKQLPGANLRPVSWWLKGHLWIGLLSVPFILFHTGGRFGGTFEKLLMAVFFLVIASGIWGVLMQHYLPRFLSTMVPAQAITEQIPVACERLARQVETVVLNACGRSTPDDSSDYSPEKELQSFYEELVRPFLRSDSSRNHPLQNPTFALARISQLEGSLPDRLQDAVTEMKIACEERRQLHLQNTIHGWLHGWLSLHLPLSVVLLVLGIVHIVMSIFY